MKNVLVTGGAGFIGSNFCQLFTLKYPEYNIINLDALTYAADLNNLKSIEERPNYKFVKGNINDFKFISQVFDEYKIDSVVHFAAESHVDNSIENPDIFIQTNINGTMNLLNVSKKYWLDQNNNPDGLFLHISTDEVYGALGPEGHFTEETPYAPNSPYSASKASSDLLVRSYNKTFGLNTIITHCSNNYGPHQHQEKFIPVIIKKCLAGENIPVYGDGKNVRDWLYVGDHCDALDVIFHKGKSGETYNIGGGVEKSNIDLANTICSQLDSLIESNKVEKYSDLISFVKDRRGHDFRYAIDITKVETELSWTPKVSFEEGMKKTIQWYLSQLT